MFVRLLLLLTIVPIVELFVLLEVHRALAEATDAGTALLLTIGSILVTGALGASLARSQGVGVLRELQRSMAEGRPPGRPLLDGAMVLVGGALLLTPGFLTDLFGLSLLVPWTRGLYRKGLASWARRAVERGAVSVRTSHGARPRRDHREAGPRAGQVIDVTPADDHRGGDA